MAQKPSYRLSADQRLKSKLVLNGLFTNGVARKAMPLRAVISIETGIAQGKVKAAFSAPKKRFRKAVDRNRIKRLIKDAYRRKSGSLQEQATELKCNSSILFVYISNQIVGQDEVDKSMSKLIEEISNLLKSS